MENDQKWNPYYNWLTGEWVHPDAPDGGTGCGFSRLPGPRRDNCLPPGIPYPDSPAARSMSLFGQWQGLATDNEDLVASENCILFIASFEALGFICPDGKVRAYQDGGCGNGNWTIGVGEFTGRDQNSIFNSEDEAYKNFVNKVKGEYSKRTRSSLRNMKVTRRLTQFEFDALVDMTYNHGNCQTVAALIANNKKITSEDFKNVTPNDLVSRRVSEFNLYSGENITVTGYKKYLRLDNTNGGYCDIKIQPGGLESNPHTPGNKAGFKVENSAKTYVLKY
jgi:GH24 family phage-related lysozyme (muramidase)